MLIYNVVTLGNARPSESPRRIESAFGFIDLEGFTALTETHGDEDAAQIATRFAKLTGSVLGKGDRHMAVHLERRVLPAVPIRHWICSLPWGLRALLGYDRELAAALASAFAGEL